MQSISLDKRLIESIDRMKTVRYSAGQNIPCEGRHTWRNIGNGAHRRCTLRDGSRGIEGRTEDQNSPPSPLLPPLAYLSPPSIQKWHPYPRNWGKDTLVSWLSARYKGFVQSYHIATNRPQQMQMLMAALWQQNPPIPSKIILFTPIELCLCQYDLLLTI